MRVELEPRRDGDGLIDDRAGHDDKLDAQTLRRRIALENAVRERGLVGAERRVAVELEGNHFLEIPFRRQRQVDDGAQCPVRAQAQAGGRPAAGELALVPLPCGEFLLRAADIEAVPVTEPERCAGADISSGTSAASSPVHQPNRRCRSAAMAASRALMAGLAARASGGIGNIP